MKTNTLGKILTLGALGAISVSSFAQISGQAPNLVGNTWFNAPQAKQSALKQAKGRVTVIQFWTNGCINCKHNLPTVNRIAAAFDPKDVQVIGVHTPETKGERDPKSIAASIKRWGIKYPILVDNGSTNWNNYNIRYWPTVIVIDQNGKIQKSWDGELNWDGKDGFGNVTSEIKRLLKKS